MPSGHVGFAPRKHKEGQDKFVEMKLLEYLFQHHDHVSYEMVLSSSGLVRIYEFFRDKVRQHKENPELGKRLNDEDKAALISLKNEDALSKQALDL